MLQLRNYLAPIPLLLLPLLTAPAAHAEGTPKPLAFPKAAPEVLALCHAVVDALASNSKELEKKLGKADKVEKVNLPNRHHPDTKDIRRMYLYRDGLVSFYSVPSLKVSYLEAAVFTKDFWPKSIPMYLGLTKKEMEQKLGKADEVDAERMVYVCSHETGDSINFLINSKSHVYRMVLRNAIE